MLTLAKIAKETGVCKATVSLILNGKAKQSHISEATVHRIQEYCRANNYLPNIHAVRMGRKIVKNIMVLLNTRDGISGRNSFSDYNVARIVGGIAGEAEQAGYSFTIRIYHPGLDENIIFNSFRSREIDGLIYYGLKMPKSWEEILLKEQRKVVGIGIEPLAGLTTVNINNREISTALTEYLIEKGHRSFLYLCGTAESFPGQERLAGFREALKRYAIPFNEDACRFGGFEEELAGKAVAEYFQNCRKRPEAIVCANDKMAIGAVKTIQRLDIKIPKAVAIAGADNIEIGRYLAPSLTTFDNLPEEMGRQAFQLLLRNINGEATEGTVVLNSNLVYGESA